MYANKIRPFLPSMNFERSKAFYKALGFQMTYEEDNLVIFTVGDVSFFIQNAYVKLWAENTMVQLFVDDLSGFYERIAYLHKDYPEIILKPIYKAHYGDTFHLIGPEGVLWHMMQIEKK